MAIKTNISKKLLIEILVLTVLVVVFVYILLTSPEYQINSSFGYDSLPEFKTIAGCEKGDKVSGTSDNGKITYSLECLGEMSSNWENFSRDKIKPILLNNGKILIYNTTQAILFDPLSKTFKTLIDKKSSSFEWNPILDRDFIKYNHHQYLIYPDILFNEQNNTFSKWNNSKYINFYKSSKFYSSNTTCLATIDNKYYLYESFNKIDDKFEVTIWLEDPLNLTRSKYGKLKTKINNLSFKDKFITGFEVIHAIKLIDGKILILVNNNIEVFNPLSGEVTFISKLALKRNPSNGPEINAIALRDGKVLINTFMYSSETSDFELYDPETNKLEVIAGYSNDAFSPYYYQADSLNELLLLSDGKVLFYGSISGIFDPRSKKFFPIKQLLVNRNYSTLTLLKDGQVLIANGYLNNRSQNKIFIYNSAELFSYKENN